MTDDVPTLLLPGIAHFAGIPLWSSNPAKKEFKEFGLRDTLHTYNIPDLVYVYVYCSTRKLYVVGNKLSGFFAESGQPHGSGPVGSGQSDPI